MRHDGQGAATEQHRRGEALVQLRGPGRGRREVAAQVPALQGRASLTGQRGREAADQSLRDELIVTPHVQEGRDHAGRPARAARKAAAVHGRRRTPAGSIPAAPQTSASRRSARARTARHVVSSQPSG